MTPLSASVAVSTIGSTQPTQQTTATEVTGNAKTLSSIGSVLVAIEVQAAKLKYTFLKVLLQGGTAHKNLL